MEFYNTTHVEIIVFSSLLGLIFAFLYDIIRIVGILCGVLSYSLGKTQITDRRAAYIMVGVGDAVYMAAVTVMFSLFVYFVNYGDYRWFMLAGAAVGFAAYEASLGKLVMAVSGTIVNGIRIAIRYVVVIPLAFVWRTARKAVLFVGAATVGRLIIAVRNMLGRRKTERMRRQLKNDIRFQNIPK